MVKTHDPVFVGSCVGHAHSSFLLRRLHLWTTFSSSDSVVNYNGVYGTTFVDLFFSLLLVVCVLDVYFLIVLLEMLNIVLILKHPYVGTILLLSHVT
jgi:hypothetical protein